MLRVLFCTIFFMVTQSALAVSGGVVAYSVPESKKVVVQEKVKISIFKYTPSVGVVMPVAKSASNNSSVEELLSAYVSAVVSRDEGWLDKIFDNSKRDQHRNMDEKKKKKFWEQVGFYMKGRELLITHQMRFNEVVILYMRSLDRETKGILIETPFMFVKNDGAWFMTTGRYRKIMSSVFFEFPFDKEVVVKSDREKYRGAVLPPNNEVIMSGPFFAGDTDE